MDNPLSIIEIKTAVIQLQNNKSPGWDGIPAEIFKALGDNICIHLKNLFDGIWETGTVPQDFRDTLLVNLYKYKGNASDCGNYRGIGSPKCWWQSAHQRLNLKSIHVSDKQWKRLASNRTEWRRVIRTYEGRVGIWVSCGWRTTSHIGMYSHKLECTG